MGLIKCLICRIVVKHFKQCLEHSEYSVNVSYAVSFDHCGLVCSCFCITVLSCDMETDPGEASDLIKVP